MNSLQSRRTFIKTITASSVGLSVAPQLYSSIIQKKGVKAISGSWFEFQHHNIAEGKYWNPALAEFTALQWEYKIKEIAKTGMCYLVLLNTAIYGKSFYPSALLPQHSMGCDDPLEAVLTAADKYGLKFFISNGFYGEWEKPHFLMSDKAVEKLRLKAMNEIAEKYSHHKSFYGWYYPNETGIYGHYDDVFINYVNTSTAEALKLTPNAKTLIAPYGTRNVVNDDKFVQQLDKLDVDIIAYQDEVGVQKSTTDEIAEIYERLYKLHKKASSSSLWADVEVFKFEGEVYKSALLPAPWERVVEQLKAVTPYVEEILIYQYTGMINRPDSYSWAGHTDSVNLYNGLKKTGYLK